LILFVALNQLMDRTWQNLDRAFAIASDVEGQGRESGGPWLYL